MLLGRPYSRKGYCAKCGQTTRHAHTATGLLWWAHAVTFQILPRVGLGRWVCLDCYSKRIVLRAQREGEGSDEGSADGGFEADGNFIVGDLSLVRRSVKNSRYTEKFRDSVVDRLMAGHATLESIRRELEVRESDLLGWIADQMRRQQEQIAQLTRLLRILAEEKNDLRLESEAETVVEKREQSASEDGVVEVAARKPAE